MSRIFLAILPILIAVGLCTFLPATARAQSVAWTQWIVTSPSARGAHAMAYDSARHRTVLFGGTTTGNDYLGDTWEWNGAGGGAWNQRMVSGPLAPSPRYNHAIAYDSARGVTVLFGGDVGDSVSPAWAN